jgi:hypothetical protein
MLTFDAFAGINNVLPETRMPPNHLVVARDVDIGLADEISRRSGFTEVASGCHKNLHQAAGFLLATSGAELIATHPDGARYVIHPAIGSSRVWYCDLPDGRVTYTNGLIHGVTDGVGGFERSVPAPSSLGAPDTALGALHPGSYRYHLTHVRLSDRIEGPAISSAPVSIDQGGLRLDGLPELDGHALNIYLSSLNGEGAYLAGVSVGPTFEYTGGNAALALPCRSLGAQPFPVGTITAFWRGRVLVAQGNVLWASRASTPHLADWRAFKQLPGEITAIQPVDDGIYVGTTQDLIWLGGATWDGLSYLPTRRGPVVLGSGVAAPGDRVRLGDGAGGGSAMVCIAGGEIVAGFSGGQTSRLAANRYQTTATEVCATFREVGGIPQYMAVPQ